MDLDSQRRASAALPSEKNTGSYYKGGWVGPKAGQGRYGIIFSVTAIETREFQ
jgi:hypothetical protein